MKTEWNREFAARFSRHEEELRRLYDGLYHRDLKSWELFGEMLYRLWLERPEALKELDRRREADSACSMRALAALWSLFSAAMAYFFTMYLRTSMETASMMIRPRMMYWM